MLSYVVGPFVERSLQQGTGPRSAHKPSQLGDKPRGYGRAPLVVAALEHVAPLQTAYLAQAGQLEPLGLSPDGARGYGSGHEAVQVWLAGRGPLLAMGRAEPAAMSGSLTSLHPAGNTSQAWVFGTGLVVVGVELGAHRLGQDLLPGPSRLGGDRAEPPAHGLASLVGHTPAWTSPAATSAAERCR
jgi:hypothetical protein